MTNEPKQEIDALCADCSQAPNCKNCDEIANLLNDLDPSKVKVFLTYKDGSEDVMMMDKPVQFEKLFQNDKNLDCACIEETLLGRRIGESK